MKSMFEMIFNHVPVIIFSISIIIGVIHGESDEEMALTAFTNLKNLIVANKDPKGQPVSILRLQSSHMNGVKDLAVRNATTEIAREVRVRIESIRNLDHNQTNPNKNKCENEKSELSVNHIRHQVLKRAGFCSDKYFHSLEEEIQKSIGKIDDFDSYNKEIEEEFLKCRTSDGNNCYGQLMSRIEGHSAEYNMELNTIFDRMQSFTMANSLEVGKCFSIAVQEGREKAKEIAEEIKSCLRNL